jgi:hypothetical protein
MTDERPTPAEKLAELQASIEAGEADNFAPIAMQSLIDQAAGAPPQWELRDGIRVGNVVLESRWARLDETAAMLTAYVTADLPVEIKQSIRRVFCDSKAEWLFEIDTDALWPETLRQIGEAFSAAFVGHNGVTVAGRKGDHYCAPPRWPGDAEDD